MATITLYDFSENVSLLTQINFLKKRMLPPMRNLLLELNIDRYQICKSSLHDRDELNIYIETNGPTNFVNANDIIFDDLNMINFLSKYKLCEKFLVWNNYSYWIFKIFSNGTIVKNKLKTWKSFKFENQKCDHKFIDNMKMLYFRIRCKAHFDRLIAWEIYLLYYICKYNNLFVVLKQFQYNSPIFNSIILSKGDIVFDIMNFKYTFYTEEPIFKIFKKYNIHLLHINKNTSNYLKQLNENEIFHFIK